MSQDILTAISDAVGTEVFGIWFLIGAALVFFMQAGFAMVEAGFTRAKNAGNIIMKNLMDFCIGTCVFILIGFGLLLSILCNNSNDCIRSYGRENKVLILLYLLRSYFCSGLSN